MRPPICDKTAPPHLENPGSATVQPKIRSQYLIFLLMNIYRFFLTFRQSQHLGVLPPFFQKKKWKRNLFRWFLVDWLWMVKMGYKRSTDTMSNPQVFYSLFCQKNPPLACCFDQEVLTRKTPFHYQWRIQDLTSWKRANLLFGQIFPKLQ